MLKSPCMYESCSILASKGAEMGGVIVILVGSNKGEIVAKGERMLTVCHIATLCTTVHCWSCRSGNGCGVM